MSNRADVAKAPTSERAPAPAAPEKGAAPAASAAAAPAAAGFKTYLPLIANVVLMPVLAYAMTAFVLVPKLAKKGGSHAEAAPAAPGGESHGSAAKSEGSHGGGGDSAHGGGKGKVTVPLSKKTLVNVSGTMGTRYLLAEFVLVSGNANFKEAVEKADAELRDAAASCLSSKTISDLEKPGVRNLVRTELITIFNTILGKGAVTEIYLTEFAIQ